MYGALFLQWLHTRRAWMVNQGYGDPFLVDPSLSAQRFDEWARQWWPLFHFLGLGTNPSGWAGIFDFWLISQQPGYLSPVSSSHTMPEDAGTVVTAPYQAPLVATASPAPVPLPGRNRRYYQNKTSTLTVQQIQHGCTIAGGEADAIERLAVVFPSGSAVTRDTLKVGRGPRARHRGYQDFTRLLDGRWYCRLCKMTGARTWKNQKEMLNHIWNTHCNPPPSIDCEPLSSPLCHELTFAPM